MKKEVGSEFWDVPVTKKSNSIFPNSVQWFLSGRSALQGIIKELNNCKTVAMPSWCCESMIKPFVKAGMSVVFYPVYWAGVLKQEINYECDILLLMDYFGYTNKTDGGEDFDGVIIRDVTHSIMSVDHDDADYFFGSLRKWCGFWTGGFLWTKDSHQIINGQTEDREYVSFRKSAMSAKERYINSNEEGKKDYLKLYEKAEERLEKIGITPANNRDVLLAEKMDVDFIKAKRRANATIIMDAFKDQIIFPELAENDCPMFVPIIVPNGERNNLRHYLVKQSIYCPVHWPISKYHQLSEKEMLLYDNGLSLICDQRYTEDDMRRVVRTIKSFWGK